MARQIFMRADEVASVLGVSKPYAYKLIQKLNVKLAKTGCYTMPGRIDRKFFYETIFYKGIMPSEKVLDFPVDCNTLTGSVNL